MNNSGPFLFRTQPSGSSATGSGGVNYVQTIFAGDSLSGVNTYNDGASSTPTDGTGGVVTGLTTALNSTTPLIGSSSLRFSKDGSNRQGEGWSYDFTVDRWSYEAARPVYIQFYYRSSSAFASSDLRVFVYDKDSATLLTVQDVSNNSGNIIAATTDNQFTGVFYTTSSNNDYRLIWHIASTNASAWDFDLDNIIVGPTAVTPGAIVSEWVSWTPTGTWVSNTTYTGRWRRDGDTGFYEVKVATSGAPTSANLYINLPSGHVIDTSKLPEPTESLQPLGQTVILDTGTAVYAGEVEVGDTTSRVKPRYYSVSGSLIAPAAVSQAAPMTWANGDQLVMHFSVPIANWAASAALSSTDVLLSTVKARYSSNAGQSISNNTTTIVDFEDVTFDNFSTVTTGGSWKFTAPKSAIYRVSATTSWASLAWDAGELQELHLYKNGVLAAVLDFKVDVNTAGGIRMLSGSTMVSLVKGDTIDIRVRQTSGGSASLTSTTSENYIDIEEIPDFSVFSTISAPYSNTLAYTPTFTGFGTAASVEMYYSRVGDRIIIEGRVTTGTVTGTEARMTLPSNFLSQGFPNIKVAGSYWINTASATTAKRGTILIEPSTAYVTFGIDDYTQAVSPLSKRDANQIFPNATILSIYCEVAII